MTGIDPSAAPPSGPARRILRLLSLPRAQSAGSYRPDIDGLRAVAVLSVLLYHLHLPMVPGGYVGVDIFFVISGFLITRNIWTEMGAGHFSVRAFYLRRIRRIAPAFLVMAGVTLVVGCLVLLPTDLARLGAGTASAAVSASNIFFWRTLDTGYFADSSEQEPLLHTWSLGVEEQFYLLWPATLLLLTVVLRGRRW
ncbi:MAG TPA: acyltransferase, partial [Candidatus Limnocylindrales bacterium]